MSERHDRHELEIREGGLYCLTCDGYLTKRYAGGGTPRERR